MCSWLSSILGRITQAPFDQASVQSDKSLQDDELKKLLVASLSTKKKNKKKKKASEADAVCCRPLL